MIQAVTAKTTQKNGTWVLLVSALLITQFLFFIDEGYYDFGWMVHWGGWLVYAIYVGIIFGFQYGISKALSLFYKGPRKALISILVGTTLGILFAIFVVFNYWY